MRAVSLTGGCKSGCVFALWVRGCNAHLIAQCTCIRTLARQTLTLPLLTNSSITEQQPVTNHEAKTVVFRRRD